MFAFLAPQYNHTNQAPDLYEMILAAWIKNPRILLESYIQTIPKLFRIQTQAAEKLFSMEAADRPDEVSNRAFKEPIWHQNPYFYCCCATHDLISKSLMQLLEKTPVDESIKKEALFLVEQNLSIFSPANFPATNPFLMIKALTEGIQPFIEGIKNAQIDIQKKGVRGFLTELAKPNGFKIGVNIATIPGKVIFKNELFELIQYTPNTARICKNPLLIVPPWINKFYVFDLSTDNSFINWLRTQSVHTFIISWANPGAKDATFNFSDYLNKGLARAIQIVQEVSQAEKINVLGYCLGGNLLACAVSKQEKSGVKSIASATYLTTIFDFQKLGVLGVFLQKRYWSPLKTRLYKEGVLNGYDLSTLFSILRSNEMVWPLFINRYFLRKKPPSLDFLHWNADPVSLPRAMYTDFVERIVQKNGFMNTEGLALPGESEKLHFDQITTPAFVLAAQKDHIAPWRSCFPLIQALKGPKTFVLSTSGHIAGVINPPAKNKYSYHHLEHMAADITAESWYNSAIEAQGSWWPFWLQWMKPYLGSEGLVSENLGSKAYPPIQDAPGSYVIQQTCKPKH